SAPHNLSNRIGQRQVRVQQSGSSPLFEERLHELAALIFAYAGDHVEPVIVSRKLTASHRGADGTGPRFGGTEHQRADARASGRGGRRAGTVGSHPTGPPPSGASCPPPSPLRESP